MALSFSRLAMVSGLSLGVCWGTHIAPLEPVGFLAPAWANTEANAAQKALADREFEQAVNFLDNETGAIWLLQQSFENIERNTIYELMTLAPSYGLIGYPAEGLALIDTALALPDAEIYRANLLADRSALYQQLGQYEAAVEAAQQSLEAAHKLEAMYSRPDTYAVAHGLYQLGRSYLMLEAIDEAELALAASLEQLDQTDYPALKAQTLYALSVAYQAQGEAAKAEQVATDALTIRTAMATFQGWDIATLEPSESLEPWDQTLLRVGGAIANIQGAIATYQELNQVADEVKARRYLGHLYEQIGLLSQAQEQFNQADAR